MQPEVTKNTKTHGGGLNCPGFDRGSGVSWPLIPLSSCVLGALCVFVFLDLLQCRLISGAVHAGARLLFFLAGLWASGSSGSFCLSVWTGRKMSSSFL